MIYQNVNLMKMVMLLFLLIIEEDQYQIKNVDIANARQKSLKEAQYESDPDLVRICSQIAACIRSFGGGGIKYE